MQVSCILGNQASCRSMDLKFITILLFLLPQTPLYLPTPFLPFFLQNVYECFLSSHKISKSLIWYSNYCCSWSRQDPPYSSVCFAKVKCLITLLKIISSRCVVISKFSYTSEACNRHVWMYGCCWMNERYSVHKALFILKENKVTRVG